jgi:hypothetical protein
MSTDWTWFGAVTLLVLMTGCVGSKIKQGNPNCVAFCETDVITGNTGAAPGTLSKNETKTLFGGGSKK